MLKITTFLILISLILASCSGGNKEKKDNSDLYAKCTTRNCIIENSGTLLMAGSDPAKKKLQLDDAKNRLRTGGGLLGKEATTLEMFTGNKKKNTSTASIGFPINPYLWKGSLETISFMPLASVDPFAGIIITDWYASESTTKERCKVNIFIKGVELKTDNLKVNSFCQALDSNNNWIDKEVNYNNNIKLENAILNKAKKIRLSQS